MATVTAGYTWTSGETVTPAKLNSAASPTVAVANDEITTAKILDGNVTDAKLASGIDASKITTGTLPIARIADDAVTNDKLSLAANAGEIKKALNADNAPPIYACRAWVNFDGTTVTNVGGEDRCTIRASGNVSKVVRTGTGVYVVHFDQAMPNAFYAAISSGAQATTANDNLTSCHSYTSTTVTVQGNNEMAGRTPALENMAIMSVAVFA